MNKVYALYEVYNDYSNVWEHIVDLYNNKEDAVRECEYLEQNNTDLNQSYYVKEMTVKIKGIKMRIEIITKDYGTITSDEIEITRTEVMQNLSDSLCKDGIYFKMPVNGCLTVIPSAIVRESIITLNGGKR